VCDFKAHLDARNLKVLGITTDGSDLDPVPLKALVPDVPHQICEFQVIKEITKAVLHALAKVRKDLKATIPQRPRGRPPKTQAKETRRAQRLEQRVSDLFEHRYLADSRRR
jgi:hypothetical protein